jgi:hypothetical protein
MSTSMRIQDDRAVKRHYQRPIWVNAVLFAILWLFLSLSLMLGVDKVLAKGGMNNFPIISISQESVVSQEHSLKPTLSFCIWEFPGLCR